MFLAIVLKDRIVVFPVAQTLNLGFISLACFPSSIVMAYVVSSLRLFPYHFTLLVIFVAFLCPLLQVNYVLLRDFSQCALTTQDVRLS